jgi:rare lipoprotein A
MIHADVKRLLPAVACLFVAACAGGPPPPQAGRPLPRSSAPPTRASKPPPRAAAAPVPMRRADVSDDTAAVARDAAKMGKWPVKIGKPYEVAGITYYPADDRTYVETGVASWYGPGFHAGNTANGERYHQDDLTAAHRTLPMPSWVEVENLDNGRTLTVRINDRGPFARSRIIDLSRKSAQLLGVDRAGTARVRLRRVYPGGQADTPPLPPLVVAAVPPPVTTVSLPSGGNERSEPIRAGWLVQVAALSDAGRVSWLKGFLSSFGPVVTENAPQGLIRVRLGPYGGEHSASAALAQVRAAGYGDARLIPPSVAR